MPRAAAQIYGFTYGQMDHEFAVRRDLKAYYLAGRTVLNLAPRAAGGLDRRPGLAHVAEIPAMATGVRLARFERNAEAIYLVVLTPGLATILRDGVVVATVALPYTAAQLPDLDWTQEWDSMLFFHGSHQPRRLLWSGNDATWALSAVEIKNPPTRQYGPDTTGTCTPSGKTGDVTFTSTANDFASAVVGQVIHMPEGHGTIKTVNSSTSVVCAINDELKSTNAASPGDWSIEDSIYSAARGWPETGCFDGNGRLILGSGNTVAGSRAGRYFDFLTTSESLDDESVMVALDDDQANQVRGIFTADHLIVITSGGPFAVPDTPITPAAFYMKRINRTRAAKIRPVEVDGVVAFVSDGGDGAYMSVFELAPEAAADSRYTCRDLALMATAVVKSPVDLAARRGTGSNSANFLFVVNTDGTLAVLHSRREQQVTAWTPWRTDGQILACAVVGNTAYFAVRRTIAGVVRHFIERLDPDHLGDCSLRATSDTPQTVWTGLDHLNGQACRVVADGAPVATLTPVGGAVTLPRPASTIEVGLPFSWKLEPMPVEKALSDGTQVGRNTRIYRAVIEVQSTGELILNGGKVPFMRFDVDTFDRPPPLFTGEVDRRLLGRSKDRTITLEGHDMVPATILAVTLFISD